jgi:hypothetical protein
MYDAKIDAFPLNAASFCSQVEDARRSTASNCVREKNSSARTEIDSQK